MRNANWFQLALIVGLIAACGDEEDDDSNGSSTSYLLTCEWLAGDNCWKTVGSSAFECVAEEERSSGVLSADGTSCTFSDGTTILFENPVNLPLPEDYDWRFRIEQEGTGCMSYRDQGDSLVVESPAGTLRESPLATTGLVISCPNGDAYRTTNIMELFECEEGGLFSLPGCMYSEFSSSVSFYLNATGQESGHLFTCSSE